MGRSALRIYAWLFAACGAVFVLAPGPLIKTLNALGPLLPWARPMAGEARSFWLGLTGSLMAVISYLAFELSRNPSQETAWKALLVSKGISASLFALFAALERNSLLLLGTVSDGLIFCHLFCLRLALSEPGDPLAMRWRQGLNPFYEVWFAKLNDPKTRKALWLRYTLRKGKDRCEAACWHVLFDPDSGKIASGRFEAPFQDGRFGEPYFRPGDPWIQGSRLVARGPGVSWDIQWRPSAPEFRFLPKALELTGLAASGYVVPAGLALFDGRISIGGTDYKFEGAPGSLGHLWGRRMPQQWRWAHAVMESEQGPAVFEILSARVRAGPFLLPWLTTAHLWRSGEHRESLTLRRAVSNRSQRQGDLWSFKVDFGDLTAEGECSPDPGLTACLEYEDLDGRRLLCRNSETGLLRLKLISRKSRPPVVLVSQGTAAVEYAQ